MSPGTVAAGGAKPETKPRYVRIDRAQTFIGQEDVEELIPSGHRARAIWELTGKLDFSEWESRIVAREGSAGRPCFDPRLLAAIWLYGYSIGVASARALSRMTESEPGLRWLTGCTKINAHTLSDFRVDDKELAGRVIHESGGSAAQGESCGAEDGDAGRHENRGAR